MDLSTLIAFRSELLNLINTMPSSFEQRSFTVAVIEKAYSNMVKPNDSPKLLNE